MPPLTFFLFFFVDVTHGSWASTEIFFKLEVKRQLHRLLLKRHLYAFFVYEVCIVCCFVWLARWVQWFRWVFKPQERKKESPQPTNKQTCLFCHVVCCSVWQCVAVCCSVLMCIAVCLFCHLVSCSVLQCVAVCLFCHLVCCSALQCVAVCRSLLQCVSFVI